MVGIDESRTNPTRQRRRPCVIRPDCGRQSRHVRGQLVTFSHAAHGMEISFRETDGAILANAIDQFAADSSCPDSECLSATLRCHAMSTLHEVRRPHPPRQPRLDRRLLHPFPISLPIPDPHMPISRFVTTTTCIPVPIV